MSGRRSSNDEGRPGGTSGGSGCSTSGRPRGTACGIIAKENADGIFFLRDLSLQVRDLSIGRIENLLSLQNIQLGGNAVLDAKIGELDGIFLRLDGLARDLELQIELQKREIVARHVADQRQYDRLPRILGGQQFGARRFRCASQLAEEVQLERCVGGQSQKVVLGLEVMLLFRRLKLPFPCTCGNRLERVTAT